MKHVSFMMLTFSLISLILLAGCKKEPESSLYDPNYKSGPQPVINSMNPPDSSFAGVGTIDLLGQHFVPKKPYNDNNQVYFDKVLASIVDMTETKITVASPSYIKDSIKVKVACRSSDLFSAPVLYKLKAAVDTTFGRLDDYKQTHIVYAVAADASGKVFAFTKVKATPEFGRILKINKDGEPTIWADNLKFLRVNVMRVGPDNKLYLAYSLGRIKEIKTIDLSDSSVQASYVKLSRAPFGMDFDQQGNLWVATQTELIRVKPDQSKETLLTSTLELKSVRVYVEDGNTFVYLLSTSSDLSQQKISKYQVNADGSLGSEVVVLDNSKADWIASVAINDFTLSAVEKMYLATDHAPDALIIYDMATGMHDYQYVGLIQPILGTLTWFGNIIYAAQYNNAETASNLLRIDVNKPGAPYYGR